MGLLHNIILCIIIIAVCDIYVVFNGIESKPVEHLIEHSNKIDNVSQDEYKIIYFKSNSSILSTSSSPLSIKTNTKGRKTEEINNNNNSNKLKQTEIDNSTSTSVSDESTSASSNNNDNNFNDNNDNNLLTTILVPLLQKFQFSPQAFFRDRLVVLREILTNLGLLSSNQMTSKQFTSLNRFLNFIGLDNSGFYTDRLEPGGLLDGNGWFSNKGGLLGGPGAILSTGPILTDYPTPYRK